MPGITREMNEEMAADSAALAQAEAASKTEDPLGSVVADPLVQAEEKTTTEVEEVEKTEPVAKTEPAPEKPQLAERLAALKNAQIKTREQQRAIAAEREEIAKLRETITKELESGRDRVTKELQAMREQTMAELEPLMKARKMLSSDNAEEHLQALQMLGFDYDTISKMVLNDGKRTPEMVEAKIRREYDERFKALEDTWSKKLEEREAAREAKIEEERRKELGSRARQNAITQSAQALSDDKHPIICGLIADPEQAYTREEMGLAVVRVIEQDWEAKAEALAKRGYSNEEIARRIDKLDIATAASMLESSLEADLVRLENARKRKAAADISKLGAEGKASSAVEDESKSRQTQGQPTLGNAEAAVVSTRKGKPLTMAERRRLVLQENPVLAGSGGKH